MSTTLSGTEAPPAGGAGLQELRDFRVSSRPAGVRLGRVQAGEVWRFRAHGEWWDFLFRCGPEGYRSPACEFLGIRPHATGFPWCALVGCVDGEDEPFLIGEGVVHAFARAGDLRVFANDMDSMRWNNWGGIQLSAQRAPGADPQVRRSPARRVSGPEPVGAWARIAWMLEKTQGFLFLAVLLLGAGLFLSTGAQGRDLLRVVADGLAEDIGPGGGRAMAWLLATAVLLGFQAWFWSRAIVEFQFGPRSDWRKNAYLKWAPRILGVLPYGFLIYGFAMAGRPTEAMELLGLGVAFLIVISLRARVLGLLTGRMVARGQVARAERIHSGLATTRSTILVLSLVAAVVAMQRFTSDPVGSAQALGPGAVTLLGLALVVPVMVLLIQVGHELRIATVLVLAALAFAISSWVDNHAVRLSPSAPDVQVQAIDARPDVKQAFDQWRAGLPPQAGPTPIIFVAAQGGASRAGFWTAEALGRLEEETRGDFSRHVFAISSISGGSLGAAAFLAAVHDEPGAAAAGTLRRRLRYFEAQDYLSPAVGGLLFPDLLQRFVPVAMFPDRAEALELGWEEGWRKACAVDRRSTCQPDRMAGDFLSVWSGGQGWTPALLIGGAIQENGRPIVTSNLRLGDFVDAADFHAGVRADVRLSTAILNGARFPYISPGGTLPGDDFKGRHIVDGGFFDAAGVEAVHELARNMFAPDAGVVPADDGRTYRPVFLVLLNGGPPPWKDACERPEAPPRQVFAQDMMGPLRGLYHSREAHGRRLLLNLREGQVGATPAELITITLCDPGVAMDWALSKPATEIMARELESPANRAQFERLKAILREGRSGEMN